MRWTALLPILLLTACGPSQEARDYAKATDLHITNMANETKALTRRETQLVEARLATAQEGERDIRAMDAVMTNVRSLLDAQGNKASSCDKRCLALLDLVLKQYEAEEKAAVDQEAADKAADKKLADQIKPLSPTTKETASALTAASKAAGGLSEPASDKDKIKFLFRYGKQVKKSYDDSREAAEKAGKKEAAAAASNGAEAKTAATSKP